MSGFVPNPSYILGHAWFFVLIKYNLEKRGLEGKSYSYPNRIVIEF